MNLKIDIQKIITELVIFTIMINICACGYKEEPTRVVSIDYLTLDELDNVEDNIYISKDNRYSEMCQNVLREVKRKPFPGSMVIATDQQIIFASGTDILQKDGEVVSPYTTYRIGSVSKLFTSVCILKLVDDKKISLDDKMDKYFPEYEGIKCVSVDNLLHMNSGIPDFVNYPEKAFPGLYDEFDSDVKSGMLNGEKMSEYMKTVSTEFEPGTINEY